MKNKLKRNFFEKDTLAVAKNLLGKYLVREIKGKKYIGKIVETEAYIGETDLACHASSGKTKRTKIMYGKAGYAYIYMIYGMYYCLNIVTEKENFPAAVLVRALEPISIFQSQISNLKSQNFKQLANGPGKLCRWMKINQKLNGIDLTKSKDLYVTEPDKKEKFEIKKAKRIGIDYAKHCAHYLWRFYIKNNTYVSKK